MLKPRLRRQSLVTAVFVVAMVGLGAAASQAGAKGLPGPESLTLVSGPDWTAFRPASGKLVELGPAQRVCMNAFAPPACPTGATVLGAPFSGWFADLTPIPGASWIWAPGVDGSTPGAELAEFVFSYTFKSIRKPVGGSFYLSADDYAALWVNGSFAGSVGSVVDPSLAGAHTYLTAFDITPLLRWGRNVIEVRAQNGPTFYSPFCAATCTYAQNPAGVAFGGTVILRRT